MVRVVGVVLAVLWWSGCGPQVDSDVVAKVGDEEIELVDLRQFREESTANYRDPEEGLQAWRFYLQTMIDMKLMLIDAQEQRLDQTVEFMRQWERERRKKLVDEYAVRTILADVDLAVEGMRQDFATSKWNRMLRLAHIRTAGEAEAQKAMRDLEQGWNFAEVARRYSIAPTAAHGGAIDAWYGRGNLEEMGLPLEVGEQIFDLQVGDLSQPLLVGEHYEIFKVLSQGPAPTHYRAAFLREQYWNEFRTRWNGLIAQLKERLNAQLDGEAIRLLVDRMAESDGRGMLLGPEEQEVILCRFKGGQVTLLDFAETYNAYWFIRSVSFDSSGIAEFIHRDLLPRTLVYQAALQEGLDQDSTIAAWLQDKKKSLLLEALRREEVVERTEVDSAMAHQYYDDHPQMFMELEEIQVAEVLVATRAEAEQLLQRVRAGERLEKLAARHTLRTDAEGGHGQYHIHNHPSERRVFGAFYDSVAAAPVGVLTGPVALDEGYSIFAVRERIPPRPTPFAQAASRARWWVQKQQEKTLFDSLFTRLRNQYADRVVVFEEQLDRLDASPASP
ncbi:MAG: hypothetical protein F4Z30_13490 [Gemmatimonadetes bacterium]|nr:hypothetical protein [Gemmatimonadota bacterium]